MTAYYFNGLPIANPVSFRSNQTVIQNQTLSLDVSRFVLPGQRWELSFRCLSGGDEVDIFNQLTANMYGESTMIMPQLQQAEARTTFSGSLAIDGAETAGSSSVAATPNASGVLAKGSFIQFNGHKKIYMVTSDVTLTNAVSSNIPIFPNLIPVLDNTDAIDTGSNVTLHYLIDDTTATGITFVNGAIADPGVIRLWEVKK